MTNFTIETHNRLSRTRDATMMEMDYPHVAKKIQFDDSLASKIKGFANKILDKVYKTKDYIIPIRLLTIMPLNDKITDVYLAVGLDEIFVETNFTIEDVKKEVDKCLEKYIGKSAELKLNVNVSETFVYSTGSVPRLVISFKEILHVREHVKQFLETFCTVQTENVTVEKTSTVPSPNESSVFITSRVKPLRPPMSPGKEIANDVTTSETVGTVEKRYFFDLRYLQRRQKEGAKQTLFEFFRDRITDMKGPCGT